MARMIFLSVIYDEINHRLRSQAHMCASAQWGGSNKPFQAVAEDKLG